MDSQLTREGRIILLNDHAWTFDILNLSHEDVSVPIHDLPDPEPENGASQETLKQQEQKWNDLGLNRDQP